MSVKNALKSATVSTLKTTAAGAFRAKSAVVATNQVLTNPFREERISFARRYNASLADSEWFMIVEKVRKCESCKHNVEHSCRHKGEQYYSGLETKVAPYDTHCPEHFDAVKSYQEHKARSFKRQPLVS